jgi:hypothetical protein
MFVAPAAREADDESTQRYNVIQGALSVENQLDDFCFSGQIDCFSHIGTRCASAHLACEYDSNPLHGSLNSPACSCVSPTFPETMSQSFSKKLKFS